MTAMNPTLPPSPLNSSLVDDRIPPHSLAMHAERAPRLEYIDPAEIRTSPWHTERYYQHAEEISNAVLLGSIRHFGGNLQPIKVRPCVPIMYDAPSIRFELVFGERRRRACQALNLPVLAMVEDLNDQQAFAQAEASTFQADGPTLLERGTRFEQAIDDQTFLSARDLVSSAGLPSDVVYKSLAIHTLSEALEGSFAVDTGLHDYFLRRLNRCADRCPGRLIGLARSTAALQWNTALSGLNEIDPPNLESEQKSIGQEKE